MARRKDPTTGKLLVEGVHPQVSARTGVVTYRARVTHGTGKRRQHASETFKDASAAEQWVLDRRMNLSRGSVVDLSTMTVDEFFDRWIERHRKKITGARYTGIMSFWRKHGQPAFGDRRIQSITRQHIQVFVDQLEENYAPKTVVNYCATLRSMFNAAEAEEVIYRTPFRHIHMPRAERKDRPIWSPLQLRRFLQATREHRYGPLWAFMVATGCRVGEAIALKPDSIWLDQGTVRIWRTETVNEIGRRVIVDRTKNGTSGHYVRLEPWIVEILAALPPGEFVFHEDDRRVAYPHVLEAFRDAADEAGLPPMNLHGLRHSVASALGNAGVDGGIIQSIIGHVSIRTTLDTYVHRGAEGQEIGTRQLARLLGFEDATDATTSASKLP